MLVPATCAGQRGKLDVSNAGNLFALSPRINSASLLLGSTQGNLTNKAKNGQQVFTFLLR
jgi:hypothetical protein